MKNVALFVVIGLFALLSACNKEACCEDIVGEWRLVEELMDPGDGSGTFQPIVSNKIVKFNSDGTFEANDDMCGLSNQSSATNHTGTYDTSTETFSPDNCMSMAPMSYRYSVSGSYLILTYPCICGCQQKYKCI
ncbi:MAG: hypothetical protein AB8B56_20675 [Crocinitomicaceae bacterium]